MVANMGVYSVILLLAVALGTAFTATVMLGLVARVDLGMPEWIAAALIALAGLPGWFFVCYGALWLAMALMELAVALPDWLRH